MKANTERVEGVVLVLIVLTVGGLAGAASFTHVKDWTMANSPTGTGDWFGWANAAISELLPLAALLTIRRRRRTGGPIGYPMFLLVCAVSLSLAAQLAVAKPGVSGWLLSAVPALAFLGLSKLVFSTTPPPVDHGRRAKAPTVVGLVDEPTPADDTDDQAAIRNRDDVDPNPWPTVPAPLDAVTVDKHPWPMAPVLDEPRPTVRRAGVVPVPAAAFPTRTNSNGVLRNLDGER
ncbi:DUF2637 domain-containing protein [Micromonospora sp. NPDC000207]|uniref:DUF2637 domain-containing protein n=1 Tax=Micromonospora sp. NPDC000207 TaxID=3154246 RepID=UPI00332CE820